MPMSGVIEIMGRSVLQSVRMRAPLLVSWSFLFRRRVVSGYPHVIGRVCGDSGRRRRGVGDALARLDVDILYDVISPVSALSWLCDRVVPHAVIAAVCRYQRAPIWEVRAGEACRRRGTLKCSRTAGAIVRFIIRHPMVFVAPQVARRKFATGPSLRLGVIVVCLCV